MTTQTPTTEKQSGEAGNIIGAVLMIALFVIILSWFLRENIFGKFDDQSNGFHHAVLGLTNNHLDFVTTDASGIETPSSDLQAELASASAFIADLTGANSVYTILYENLRGSTEYDTWSPIYDPGSGGAFCVDRYGVIDPGYCIPLEATLPVIPGTAMAFKKQFRLGIWADLPGLTEPLMANIPVRTRQLGTSSAVTPGGGSPAPSP